MATGADDIKDARGMAVADFDNDGDLDIVINTNPGDVGKTSVPPALLRNELGQTKRWLAVELEGTKSNRDAVGTQVIATVQTESGVEQKLLRHVTAGGGYASQNSSRLYFGLGNLTSIQSLFVRWPSGKTHQIDDIQTNQLLRISENGRFQAGPLPQRIASSTGVQPQKLANHPGEQH